MAVPSRFQTWTQPILTRRVGYTEEPIPDPDPEDPTDYAHEDEGGSVQVLIEHTEPGEILGGGGGTVSSGSSGTIGAGGPLTPANPTNANDGTNAQSNRPSCIATGAAGTTYYWWAADLGSAAEVNSMTIDGIDTGSVAWRHQGSANVATLLIEHSDDGSSWTSTAYTHTGPDANDDHFYTITTPSTHRYWRIRKVLTPGGFASSDNIQEWYIYGADVTGEEWTAAGAANDGDDASYATSDATGDTDDEWCRVALTTERLIYLATLRLACETSGARSYSIWGSDDAEFTTPVLLATEAFTATGSFTPQDIAFSWIPEASYQYYQITGNDETRRLHDINLYSAVSAGFGVTDHPQLTGRDDAAQHPAAAVSYDNGTSGLAADEVQAAIDEIAATAAAITVEDGSTSVTPVDTIVFDGATVTDDTGGQVTVTVEAGGGGGTSLGGISLVSTNTTVGTGATVDLPINSEDYDPDGWHHTSTAALTGTVTKTASSLTLTGSGTAFLTELSAGQVLSIPGTATEIVAVRSIESNTSLTLWAAPANTASGQTATRKAEYFVVPANQGGSYLVSLTAHFGLEATPTFATYATLHQQTSSTATTQVYYAMQTPNAGTNGVNATEVRRRTFAEGEIYLLKATNGNTSSVDVQAIVTLVRLVGSTLSAAVGVSVRRTSNWTGLTTPSDFTDVPFNDSGAEEFDTHGFHSTSSNTERLTIPAGMGGKYLIGYTIWFDPSVATGIRATAIFKNGSSLWGRDDIDVAGAAGGLQDTGSSSVVLDLAAGDYVSLRAYHSTGGTVNVMTQTQLWMVRLSATSSSVLVTETDASPSVAASEIRFPPDTVTDLGSGVVQVRAVPRAFIGVSLINSGVQNIGSSATANLTFDTEEWDTDGFHSTSSNTSRVTIPAGLGGKYLVLASTFQAAGEDDAYFYVGIEKNGSAAAAARVSKVSRGTSDADNAQVSLTMDLAAGDYIEVEVFNGSSSARDYGHASVDRARSRLQAYKLDSGTVGQGIGALVYHSTTQTVNNTVVPFDSEVFDTDGFHSTSSNTSRLTIPAGLGGLYLLEYGSNVASLAAGEFFRIRRTPTGGGATSLISLNEGGTSGDELGYLSGQAIYRLDAGDYVELYFTGNRTLGHASAYEAQSHFGIARLDSSTSFGTGITYTPSWTSDGSAPAIGNGTLSGRYRLVNDTLMHLLVRWVYGSTSSAGTGNYSLSLPSGWKALSTGGFTQTAPVRLLDSGTAHYGGTILLAPSGTTFQVVVSDATGVRLWAAGVPITLATSDELNVTAWIEVERV